MKRKELRAYLGVTVWNVNKDHDADVYVKSHVDPLLDKYERRIGRLTKCVNMWHKVNEDLQTKNGILRNRIKELEEEKTDSTKKIVGLIEYGAGLQHDIKELEREKAALLKTQEFHLEQIKELESTISILETTGWVSVKDRMPEDQQQVLCIDIQGSIFHSFHETYENKRGIDSAWWNYNGGLLRDVTHWMPLPPPPKEEGK